MTESYREKLKRLQQQESQDKGKTGLGKINVFDFDRAPRKFSIFQERRGTKQEDENAFDIALFRISEPWVEKLKTPSGRLAGLKVGDLYYKIQVPVHKGMGPNKSDIWLCRRLAFGDPCIRCDDMFTAYKEGKKELGEQLKTTWVCGYNIFDYNDQDRGWQFWQISYYMFESTTSNDPQRANLLDAQLLEEGGVVTFADFKEGSTVVAKFKEKKFGKSTYSELFDIKFEPRDQYDESVVLDQVLPLDKMVVVPDYETFRSAHYLIEGAEADSNDAPEETETEKLTETRTRQRHTRERASTSDNTAVNNGKDKCPAGHEMGKDCNQYPECEGTGDSPCTEETFRKCADILEELAKQANKIEEKKPEVSEQKQEDTGGTTRRRRNR